MLPDHQFNSSERLEPRPPGFWPNIDWLKQLPQFFDDAAHATRCALRNTAIAHRKMIAILIQLITSPFQSYPDNG